MTPPPARGTVAWLVGAFALWQLAFPLLANLTEFVPVRPGPADVNPPIETTQRWGRFTSNEALQTAAERLVQVLAVWGELTGQEQGWNMFTPAFPPYSVVAIAEVSYPDGRVVRVPSRFADRVENPRARWPVLDDREFNYEADIVMLAWHCHPATLAADPTEWARLPGKVRDNEHLIVKWLAWKAKRAGGDPAGVTLTLRYTPTNLPGREPGGPFERPFARWFPGRAALEGYDPVGRRFVPLPSWGKP